MMVPGAWSWGAVEARRRAFEAGRPPEWPIPPAAPNSCSVHR